MGSARGRFGGDNWVKGMVLVSRENNSKSRNGEQGLPPRRGTAGEEVSLCQAEGEKVLVLSTSGGKKASGNTKDERSLWTSKGQSVPSQVTGPKDEGADSLT